jgi:hypothetical protein
VHERRSLPRTGVVHRGAHRLVAGEEVGTVDTLDEQSRERLDELRDVAARRLHFHRHRDRVAVVFDQVDDGQLERAGRVERFPEFAFARRTFPDRHVRDFIGVEARLAPLDGRDVLIDAAGFGGADGMETLRARRARLRDDVERRVAPVGRHLPPAGARVVLRADGAQEHLARRDAERQAQRPVAVVRKEPVDARLERHPGRDEHAFVPGAADLEENQALVLELNFLVIQLP